MMTRMMVVVLSVSSVVAAEPSKRAIARCNEPCLVLTDTPLDQAASVYRATCGVKPDPDYLACRTARYDRACIAAAHGVASKQTSLGPVLAAKAWFHADASFKLDALSDVEKANRKALTALENTCEAPTAGDIALAKQWLAALPKLATTPADSYANDSSTTDRKVTAAQLKAYLATIAFDGRNISLADQLAGPYESISNVFYVATELDPYVPSFARAVDARADVRVLFITYNNAFGADGKLKPAETDVPPPPDESGGTGTAMALDEDRMGKNTHVVMTEIWLAYDAKNALVAVGVAHQTIH
jgi:hypothetical protein